jgi:hypothetical protein
LNGRAIITDDRVAGFAFAEDFLASSNIAPGILPLR